MADGKITFSTALDNKQLAKDIARSAKEIELVFDAAGKIFEAGAKYFNELVQSNAEYQAQVAKLRAALATAFQPLYEAALPICLTILQVLTDIATVAANIFSGLFGKTAKQSADNAKALNKEAAAIKGVGSAAKQAKNSLASFDQINRLEDEQSGSGGGSGVSAGIGMDFSVIGDELTETQKKIAEILKGVLLVAVGMKLWKIAEGLPGILGTVGSLIGRVLVGVGLAIIGFNLLKDGITSMIEEGPNFTNVLQTMAGVLLLGAGAAVIFSAGWPLIVAAIAAAVLGIAYYTGHAEKLIDGLKKSFEGLTTFFQNVGKDNDAALGGLATAWDGIKETIWAILQSIEGYTSVFMAACGLILALSGINIPLGIGLIALGCAGMVATVAENWDTISTELQGPLGAITAVSSTLLLALGIILVFSGVGIPLGLGLILAGAAGLATETAANWDFITDTLDEIWGNVIKWWDTNVAPKFTAAYWSEKFAAIGDGMKEAIKNGINAAIGLMNQFINWVNEFLSFDIPAVDLGVLGSFGGAHMQLVSIPNIPLLAQGAVIPPNAPFMAMLGDQRNGTNLEAPEDLIRQIVREEAGDNSQVVAMLAELIAAVRGIRVGDDTIGRAASRYIARTDRVLGR